MAYEKDVESVEAIIRAIYSVLSGPAGPKDWARQRYILHPTARMMRGLPPGAPRFFLRAIHRICQAAAHGRGFLRVRNGPGGVPLRPVGPRHKRLRQHPGFGPTPLRPRNQQHPIVVRWRAVVGDGSDLGLGRGRKPDSRASPESRSLKQAELFPLRLRLIN